MSKKGRRSGTCVFCGTFGLLTREDATPKWLGRFIQHHFPPEERWESVEIRFGDDKPPSQRSKIAGNASVHKPIVVCGSCNNGWMSRLEVEAKPLLMPLILGTATHLDNGSSLTLATWATKTALIYEFVYPESEGTTASADDRRWFAEHRRPLPNSRIWCARYVGTRGAAIIARSTLFLYDLDDPAPTPEAHGLFIVLVFGQIAIRVALIRSNPTYPMRFGLWEGEQTQLLWPSQSQLNWPTTDALDDVSLQTFMSVQSPRTGSRPR